MRKLSFAIVTAALVGLFAGGLFASGNAAANPKGLRTADIGHLLWNAMIIVKPNDWNYDDDVCGNSGHRIFFDDDNGGTIGTILWVLDPSYNGIVITDCDGTDGSDLAVVNVDESIEAIFAIRLLGPRSSAVELRCLDTDDEEPHDDLCYQEIFDLDREGEKEFTKIANNLFDNEYEEMTWEFTKVNGKTVKAMNVRIYEYLQ